MKNSRQTGFTLLEILVVISVFVLVIALVNQIFFSTLKGTSKSQATSTVKQNGNYAVSIMQRSLYGAREITQCLSDRVAYLDLEGKPASFLCLGAGTDAGYIASGSARLTSEDVSLTNCVIRCTTAGASTEVDISFGLKRKVGERVEEKTTLPFQTRVILRN